MYVAGLLVAQIETARHTKFDVQLSSRIAVDGERCASALFVASDGSWLATADDSEGACWVDALEVFGWEVLGELTYVVLAMLLLFVNIAHNRLVVPFKLLTPQKKCLMNTMTCRLSVL